MLRGANLRLPGPDGWEWVCLVLSLVGLGVTIATIPGGL